MQKNSLFISFMLSVFLCFNGLQVHAAQAGEPVADRKLPNFQKVVNALAMRAAGLTPDQICDRLNSHHTCDQALHGTPVNVGGVIFYKHGNLYHGYWSTERPQNGHHQ